MKEKDFDEIGKRLHDLEADPPKDAWAKISPLINATKQPGKVVWLRKNWWKPLVILIPMSAYLIFYNEGGRDLKLSSSITSTSSEQTKQAEENLSDKSAKNHSNQNEASIQNETLQSGKDETQIKEYTSSSEKSIRKSLSKNLVPDKANRKEDVKNNEQSLIAAYKAESKYVSVSKEDISESDNQSLVIGPDKENKKEKEEVILPVVLKGESSFQSLKREGAGDSLANEEVIMSDKKDDITDTLSSEEITQKENKKKGYGPWRISAVFAPQYVMQSVQPVTSDEVLITAINSSGNVRRSGFGVSLGAGKAITPSFYLDGQFSYTQMQQDIQYSYSTGLVDTLLAVQQSDQSVLVTPVYKVNDSQISSKYGYGGLKLGATYYFLSTARSRFNINATAGAHYLFTAEVREKINGEWVEFGNENLEKMNYSLMIGAGYNISIAQGWELMINPALTYYLKSANNESLPFSQRPRFFGLNFMLSKTLGK
jgi:hypothetical protein